MRASPSHLWSASQAKTAGQPCSSLADKTLLPPKTPPEVAAEVSRARWRQPLPTPCFTQPAAGFASFRYASRPALTAVAPYFIRQPDNCETVHRVDMRRAPSVDQSALHASRGITDVAADVSTPLSLRQAACCDTASFAYPRICIDIP